MAAITVTAALEEQLRSLCLGSFPCGTKGTRVSNVDEQLLSFSNLEELVLSANKITNVTSSSLPQTLKVLELGSNQISTLKDLTVNPPPMLQHLGLAYNRIQHPSESEYLTADFWPNIVSLDLSFNDLTDIFDLVPRLCSLQHLRVLVLQGNPLTFFPAYRGFTIDSLPLLFALDDVPILPDERHQFSGLSSRKGALGKSAMMLVNIGKLRGIPNPINSLEAQDPGEYPVITYNYHASYEFIEDQTSREEDHIQTAVPVSSKTAKHPQGTLSSLLPQTPFHTGSFKTSGTSWLDPIDFKYNRKHEVKDLLALKSFFLAGMMVIVTEEKTSFWPLDHDKTTVPKSAKKGGKEKDKGRPSSKASKAGAKTKNKKEHLDELQRDPPVLKTLGVAHVTLESLVLGEMTMSTICKLKMCCTDPEEQPTLIEKDSKKSKDRKKSGRESVDTHKNSASSAGKSKNKMPSEISPGEEQQVLPEPVPLTLEIQIIRLNSTSEAELGLGKSEVFMHKP
ncbi:leucine-rich repeat-containing protein 43 isoform X2 [Xenopus laevis]|uniref:Leucine-rich repeat-containing protein 43 isoform X2 n=1 Tax=Xenopus laevis TaxID=8355 RepID=A0A8J0VC04_XENLA|nr:leucine-rich repeat-containing protein 43 isoform X2 [Xenopus laevis]